MAGRPPKKKLDYFSLDVDYFMDPKFIRLRTEYGITGEMIAIRLFCEIYRQCYYIEWSENLQYALADAMRLKPTLISDVVHAMVRYGFFDEAFFNQFGILTSKGIQKRWKIANERRKNKGVEFWLLPINDDSNAINDSNNSIDVNNNAYKLNQTKSNQIKYIEEEEERARDVSDPYKFYEYLFSSDLTNGQRFELNTIIKDYGEDDVYEAMEGMKDRTIKHPLRYLRKVLVDQEKQREVLE